MISGKTIPFGLFGYPVGHTFSPSMHNAAFKKLNIDAIYLPFKVKPEDLEIALKSLSCLGFGGINITVPHKQSCMKYLHKIDRKAELIGAVNTIKVQDKRLVGYNTDGEGFIKSLKEKKVDLDGKRILILGAGGAARAITVNLIGNSGIKKIFLYDMDSNKSKNLVKHLNSIESNIAKDVQANDLEDIMKKVNILVNATPVGLKKGDIPINRSLLKSNLDLVYDLIYNPPQTELLKAARDKGVETINGLSMLVHQGAVSFNIWIGINPPLNIMAEAVLSEIE